MSINPELTVTIIKLVISFVIAFAFTFIVPYVTKWLKSKEYYEQIVAILVWARQFVKYAENSIMGEKKGQERFEKVSELLSDKSKEIGLNLSEEDVASIIESAYTDVIKNLDEIEE